MTRLVTLLLTVLLVLGLAVPTSAGAGPATLVATVGPGLTIALKTSGGRPVKVVKAGSYVIVVRDRSRVLNFRLFGPTPDAMRSTTLKFVGTTRWRLKLTKGSYRYRSDRRTSRLNGSFRVS